MFFFLFSFSSHSGSVTVVTVGPDGGVTVNNDLDQEGGELEDVEDDFCDSNRSSFSDFGGERLLDRVDVSGDHTGYIARVYLAADLGKGEKWPKANQRN